MMALHSDFAVIVWSLVASSAAARWLPERKPRATRAVLALSAAGVAAAAALRRAAAALPDEHILFLNPVNPLAQGVFTASTPTVPGAAEQVSNVMHWRPRGRLPDRLLSAAGMVFTFSFEPKHFGSLSVFARCSRSACRGCSAASGCG